MQISSTHPGKYFRAGVIRTRGFVAVSDVAGKMVQGCGGSLDSVQRPLPNLDVVDKAVDLAVGFQDDWIHSAAGL